MKPDTAPLSPPSLPDAFWSTDDQRRDILGQAEKLAHKGPWRDLPSKPDVGAIGFPVPQKKAVRLCVDFRKASHRQAEEEKCRLLGTRAQIEMKCDNWEDLNGKRFGP